jgi:hypothetical protein
VITFSCWRTPLAGLPGRDQQQLLHPGESTFQTRGIVIIAWTNDNTFSVEGLRLGGISDDRGNLLCRHSLHQGIDDKPAELASGAGYCEHEKPPERITPPCAIDDIMMSI